MPEKRPRNPARRFCEKTFSTAKLNAAPIREALDHEADQRAIALNQRLLSTLSRLSSSGALSPESVRRCPGRGHVPGRELGFRQVGVRSQNAELVGIATGKDAPLTVPKHAMQMLGLPSPNIKRWTSRRKAAVVIAISNGRIPRKEACTLYQISEEELLAWEDALKAHGYHGLRASRRLQYRRPL